MMLRDPKQRLVVVGTLLLFWTAPGILAEDEEPPPQVQSRTLRLPDGEVHDAILPGRALDVTAFPGGGAVVLVAPEDDADGPRALYRVRGLAEDLEPLRTDLPAEAESVVARPGGLWVGVEDRILFLPVDGDRLGEPRSVLEIEGLRLGSLRSRGLIQDETLYVPEVGRLRVYTASAGSLEPADELPLPVSADRSRYGFMLESPSLSSVDGASADGSSAAWGSEPEALGDYRFRAYRIDSAAASDPAAADDDSEDPRMRELFFRFRGPESVERHFWTRIDGRDGLITATAPSDKLGIFQKLNLRLFLVGADRTRAGRGPRAELKTVARRWSMVGPKVRDVDGDGKDDLILVQEEGLSGDHLVIDIYRGRGTGLLETRRPRRTKLKDRAGSWHLDTDFDGDGHEDFVLLSGGRLEIYGLRPSHKKKVLEDEPFFVLDRGRESDSAAEVTVTLGVGTGGTEVDTISARGSLHVFDTDASDGGDSRPEIVLMRTVRGRAVVRVVSVR